MLADAVSWGWRRLRPEEGWFPHFLLLIVILSTASAVLIVDWVPESTIIPWISIIGLLIGSVLAKRPLKGVVAWIVIAAYGLFLNLILLGHLSPPLPIIIDGWSASSAHIRQNIALTADRIGGWSEAAFGGGSSNETLVFALGLGFLAYFLAAYAGWSTFRQRRPFAGLTALGFALAINGYFGDAPIWPAAIFVGLAALLTAAVHYANLERVWSEKNIDFSTEIRLDLLGISGGIALVLVSFAFVLPVIDIRSLSQAVINQTAVKEAEEVFDRAFAGVRQPRGDRLQIDLEGKPGGSGTLPRSFLIGAPPELYETVVMTAATNDDGALASHWRGYSYDVYTGRGWAISTERQESIPAGQDIDLPTIESRQTLNQSVHWVQNPLSTRYTLGLPVRFDQDVSAFWRGVEDLSRVQSQGGDYTATSQLSSASPAELRSVTLTNVPPEILARYTALPDSVPLRVHDLAHQIAGRPDLSPFDQATALERFLRQYPYSLDVELPPSGSDPVDYFLFDLQTGYCDYYASAMVVLARTLGLPARLAAGFLAQSAGEDGVQTIYQINAHSWAEIYFAGYGWVEFEPTAPFPTRDMGETISVPPEFARDEPVPVTYPPPIPEPEEWSISPFWWLLAAASLVIVLWSIWNWRVKRQVRSDGVLWAYGRLIKSARRLGQHTPSHQTPSEFEAALLSRLDEPARTKWGVKLRHDVQSDIVRLGSIFVDHQYGGKPPQEDRARESWYRIRGRMWMLGLINKLFGRRSKTAREEE